MILVDTNLLVYSYVQSLPQHSAARSWLDTQFRGTSGIALPWPSLLGFLRLVTNPRIFSTPASITDAWNQIERWLSFPVVWSPNPTPRHAEELGKLLRQINSSNKVPDVHLAALAIEHDLTLCSSDGGFRGLAGLKWRNPISPKSI